MKKIILFSSIAVMAGLLFTNTYNSIVDAENWCSSIPESIDNLRNYYSISNPGNFFRIFSPINQVLAILALILFWRKGKNVRLFLAFALASALIGEALTFGFFYPINEIILTADLRTDLEKITDSCSQWQTMNWVRSFIILMALIFQFSALNRIKLGESMALNPGT